MKKIAITSALVCAVPLAAGADGTAENTKKLNVYYSNWSIYSPLHQNQEVSQLPWDRLSTINHAFWNVEPNADKTEFPIKTSDEWSDLRPGGAFDQYAEMTELYPDVDVVLSIGGWGGQWFSLMASTPENRASFIQSCVDTMTQYPFLNGIDVDWEYPGTSRNGEGPGFVGSNKDKETFTLLCKEMREGFDAAGFEDAIITFCASTSVGSYRSGSIALDFAAVAPYVDRINIMTYDMSGPWSGQIIHHSALYPGKYTAGNSSASEAAEYLISLGVDPGKINLGSPLYSHGWVVKAEDGEDALGKPSRQVGFGTMNNGQMYWHELKQLENTPGWETGYDEEAGAAYLYNNDPASGFYGQFYSYESERSLQAKLDYINEMGLGGLIVWDTPGDRVDAGFPMLSQMAKGLGIYDGDVPVYNAQAFVGGPPDPAQPVALPDDEKPSPEDEPPPAAGEDAVSSPEPEQPSPEPAENSPAKPEEPSAPMRISPIVWIGAGIVLVAGAVLGIVLKNRKP
jgi:chitinase